MKRLTYGSFAVLVACSGSDKAQNAQSPLPIDTMPHTYSTEFTQTESPISESGRWLNGGTDGKDWTDVSISAGHAIGHQVGASYTDATALLKGTWGADQSATATVFTSGVVSDDCFSEVELRLRSTLAAHDNHGYEISFKVSQGTDPYVIIVRWNGALGNFTYLLNEHGSQYGVKSGDIVRATAIGNVITAYKNGVVMGQATDGSYPTGNPGLGFNLENGHPGCPGTNDRYGFSSYTATDVITP